MFDEMIHIFKNNEIEEIYFTGCFDDEDQDFTTNLNYLFFEFGSQYICVEAIECYSKLKINLNSSIIYRNEIEDLKDGKVGISELIFTNPLANNKKIKKASFFNLKKETDYIICDVLCLELFNGEIIFLDPSFLGIKIGGMRQKEFWEENLDSTEDIFEDKFDFTDV